MLFPFDEGRLYYIALNSRFKESLYGKKHIFFIAIITIADTKKYILYIL